MGVLGELYKWKVAHGCLCQHPFALVESEVENEEEELTFIKYLSKCPALS